VPTAAALWLVTERFKMAFIAVFSMRYTGYDHHYIISLYFQPVTGIRTMPGRALVNIT
jgi:hypothetical protein